MSAIEVKPLQFVPAAKAMLLPVSTRDNVFSPAPSHSSVLARLTNGLGRNPRPFSHINSQNDLLKRLGHVA
jgi:hypothetical protein